MSQTRRVHREALAAVLAIIGAALWFCGPLVFRGWLSALPIAIGLATYLGVGIVVRVHDGIHRHVVLLAAALGALATTGVMWWVADGDLDDRARVIAVAGLATALFAAWLAIHLRFEVRLSVMGRPHKLSAGATTVTCLYAVGAATIAIRGTNEDIGMLLAIAGLVAAGALAGVLIVVLTPDSAGEDVGVGAMLAAGLHLVACVLGPESVLLFGAGFCALIVAGATFLGALITEVIQQRAARRK